MPNLQLTDREKVTILDNIRGSVDRYIEQYKESHPSPGSEYFTLKEQIFLMKKSCAEEIEKIKDIIIQEDSLQSCLETWPGLWEFIPGYIKEEYEAPRVWGRPPVRHSSNGTPTGFLTLDMIIVVLKLKGE